MKSFDDLWADILKRCDDMSFPLVQEKSELLHVYELMEGCKTYLEVGSAEGNSLHVLGYVVSDYIDYIDLGEEHTKDKRQLVVDELVNLGKRVTGYIGDSTNKSTLPNKKKYDCILIDGGHDYDTVLSDCMMYAELATKYVFFHDVQLLPVSEAIEFYLKRWPIGKYRTFINSDSFGFGILEINP